MVKNINSMDEEMCTKCASKPVYSIRQTIRGPLSQRKMSKVDKSHQNRPNLRQVAQTFQKLHKPETKFGNYIFTLKLCKVTVSCDLSCGRYANVA